MKIRSIVISAIVAGSALAACGHTGFQADYKTCYPVVSGPVGSYPQHLEDVCQAWNARQGAAFESAHAHK